MGFFLFSFCICLQQTCCHGVYFCNNSQPAFLLHWQLCPLFTVHWACVSFSVWVDLCLFTFSAFQHSCSLTGHVEIWGGKQMCLVCLILSFCYSKQVYCCPLPFRMYTLAVRWYWTATAMFVFCMWQNYSFFFLLFQTYRLQKYLYIDWSPLIFDSSKTQSDIKSEYLQTKEADICTKRGVTWGHRSARYFWKVHKQKLNVLWSSPAGAALSLNPV